MGLQCWARAGLGMDCGWSGSRLGKRSLCLTVTKDSTVLMAAEALDLSFCQQVTISTCSQQRGLCAQVKSSRSSTFEIAVGLVWSGLRKGRGERNKDHCHRAGSEPDHSAIVSQEHNGKSQRQVMYINLNSSSYRCLNIRRPKYYLNISLLMIILTVCAFRHIF